MTGMKRLPGESIDRRRFVRRAGIGTLSAGAVAILGGREGLGQGMARPAADADILNVALGLEHEAVAAYQLGAESGLLQRPALDIALLFQSHHKQHRDALAAAVGKLGGRPVAEKSKAEYAQMLNAGALRSQADVLTLAVKLERAAVNAYLSVIPAFGNKELAQVAGRLAADEAMHWTALAGAAGQTLPANALSFGA